LVTHGVNSSASVGVQVGEKSAPGEQLLSAVGVVKNHGKRLGFGRRRMVKRMQIIGN